MDNIKSKALFVFVSVAFLSSIGTICFNKRWMVEGRHDEIIFNAGAVVSDEKKQVQTLKRDLELSKGYYAKQVCVRNFICGRSVNLAGLLDSILGQKIIDANMVLNNGDTLLRLLVTLGELDSIKIAVRHGAKVSLRAREGSLSPLELVEVAIKDCFVAAEEAVKDSSSCSLNDYEKSFDGSCERVARYILIKSFLEDANERSKEKVSAA